MFAPLLRKGRQVLHDPVLRHWMMRRTLGLEPAPPAPATGRPPYLDSLDIGKAAPRWTGKRADLRSGAPRTPVSIALPGETVHLDPADPGALFVRTYADLETELAAHRFAWVPLAGDAADPSWVESLWSAWLDRFGDAAEGWPWHAYTVAERAINLIDFARRHGLPGDERRTLTVLARHADVIAANLEYFGDHYTSNHLSNNGRGLLRIGTALGLDRAAALGASIMIAEAERIFGAAGTLREGSTHYHLLATRNYIDAWLEAAAAGRPEAAALRAIASRALQVAPRLRLSGGLPLIGDISPDCPPAFLACLASDRIPADGWLAQLDDDRRSAFAALRTDAMAQTAATGIDGDGWHRFGGHGWDALTFVPGDGWVPMPGHGHQDLAGFELHADGVALIVDPGRGSYRDRDADRIFETAAVHSGIAVDGYDPAPPNRPYYSAAWRARIVPARPAVQQADGCMRLVHSGFRRLRGVGEVTRDWRFSRDRAEISDRVDGRGSHRVARRLCTPHRVTLDGADAVIDAAGRRYRVAMDADVSLSATTCWTAYGEGTPGTLISAETPARLPFAAVTAIERLS